MKKVVTILLIACCILFAGCGAADDCRLIPPEDLTQEALHAFASLDGERGLMLYADPAQMGSREIRMYAVLYGPMGQELSLSRSFTTLKMQVSGEAGEGYAVWRITYDPSWIRRAEFVGPAGDTLTMDGYEELSFVAEKVFQQEEE